MMLNNFRLALAATVLTLAAGATSDHGSAQDLIEYALMAGFVDFSLDIPDADLDE